MKNFVSIKLVFIVESDKTSASDAIYINAIINDLYLFNNEVVVRYIYMGGKSNYNKPKIKKQIAEHQYNSKQSKRKKLNLFLTTTFFIYVFDTDNYKGKIEDRKIFIEEFNYCKENNYLLVYFNSTIEEVVLGKKITKNKRKEASNFAKKPTIDINKLTASNNDFANSKRSNLLTILDSVIGKYRKK